MKHERGRTFKASKQVVEDVRKAAQVISTKLVEIKTARNPKGAGRKPVYKVAKKEVAVALGMSTTAVVDAEQHVETAEYPLMQREDWRHRVRMPAERPLGPW
jgi:hypothetical protein